MLDIELHYFSYNEIVVRKINALNLNSAKILLCGKESNGLFVRIIKT